MPSAVPLVPGQIFARDYKIIRPLAQGGMGSVYVVEQLSTSEQRALKTLHPQFVTDPRARIRFDREARVAAQIQSAHVVRIVQAGVDEATGMPWLCMELLAGETMADAIQRGGCFAPATLATLFEQIGHALELAHRIPLVHRDLKPENIFLAAAQSPGVPFTAKVLDFGIAKLVQESATTQAVGSPLWMAPEQLGNAPVSPATDVWALGLVAFHALTGRYYWRAANEAGSLMSVIVEMASGAPVPASQRAMELGAGPLPGGFDGWFARCLALDEGARFPHAGVARDALLAILGSDRPGASQPVAMAFEPTGTMPMVGPSRPLDPTTPAPSAYRLPTPAPGALGAFGPTTPAPGTFPPGATAQPAGAFRAPFTHARPAYSPTAMPAPAPVFPPMLAPPAVPAGRGGLGAAIVGLGFAAVAATTLIAAMILLRPAGRQHDGTLTSSATSAASPAATDDTPDRCGTTRLCPDPMHQICTLYPHVRCEPAPLAGILHVSYEGLDPRWSGGVRFQRVDFHPDPTRVSTLTVGYSDDYLHGFSNLTLYLPEHPTAGRYPIGTHPGVGMAFVTGSENLDTSARYRGSYESVGGELELTEVDFRFGGHVAGQFRATVRGGNDVPPVNGEVAMQFYAELPPR